MADNIKFAVVAFIPDDPTENTSVAVVCHEWLQNDGTKWKCFWPEEYDKAILEKTTNVENWLSFEVDLKQTGFDNFDSAMNYCQMIVNQQHKDSADNSKKQKLCHDDDFNGQWSGKLKF